MFQHPSRKSLQERQLDIRYETLRIERKYQWKVLLLDLKKGALFFSIGVAIAVLFSSLVVGALLL